MCGGPLGCSTLDLHLTLVMHSLRNSQEKRASLPQLILLLPNAAVTPTVHSCGRKILPVRKVSSRVRDVPDLRRFSSRS